MPILSSTVILFAQAAASCECDADIDNGLDCLNVTLIDDTVPTDRGRFLPTKTTRGNTEFFATGDSRSGLRLTSTFDHSIPDTRRWMLATDESGVIFAAKPEVTNIVVDWVPQGGGPLEIWGFRNGVQERIAVDPHPEEQHFLQQFSISVAETEGYEGFHIVALGESGFVRACVGPDVGELPRPIEEVLQVIHIGPLAFGPGQPWASAID